MTASLYQSGSLPRSLNRVFLLVGLLLVVVCAKSASAISRKILLKTLFCPTGKKLYRGEIVLNGLTEGNVTGRSDFPFNPFNFLKLLTRHHISLFQDERERLQRHR